MLCSLSGAIRCNWWIQAVVGLEQPELGCFQLGFSQRARQGQAENVREYSRGGAMVLPKSPAEVYTRKQEGTEEAKVSKAGARGRISDLFKSNMYSSQPLTCNQKPREVLP